MNERVNQLGAMLTYRRGERSAGEEAFIQRFISCVPGMLMDKYGNYYLQQGETATMFSCHTDSVHSTTNDAVLQSVQTDSAYNFFFKEKGTGCLGADDAVGCFIMLEMIEAGVPGLYVFHRDEERGGKGSDYIAQCGRGKLTDVWYQLLQPIKRAIAFDRRGTTNVITHQGFERTASDTFAKALSTALGGLYAPCDEGIFTDTANYSGLIPECTNLSCGYDNEHTDKESVDVNFVMWLLNVSLNLDWEALPTERDPSVVDSLWGSYATGTTFLSKKNSLSDATLHSIKTMSLSEMKEFLEFCRVTDDDLADFCWYGSTGNYADV